VRTSLSMVAIPMLAVALGADGDDKARATRSAPVAPIKKSAATPAPPFSTESEADAMAFVRRHHPELATVLEALRPMDPAEYRKAIGELSQVSRTLAEVQARTPRRYDLALDAWKARSRVELLAAQLAGSPSSAELRSDLRTAIEARVDVEIRRQKFELEQAEAAAKKARDNLERLENHRDAAVEARFRMLLPKKPRRAKQAEAGRPPAPRPAPVADPNREERP